MSNHILHFTDLSFFHYCHKKFRVNRGVFNTIDEWFYNKGEVNILQRRKHMIKFLAFVTNDETEYVKFGPGGLSTKLIQYWEETYCLVTT